MQALGEDLAVSPVGLGVLIGLGAGWSSVPRSETLDC